MSKKEGVDKGATRFIQPKISSLSIPTSIFQDRRLSVLEVLVEYLKEGVGLRFSEISVLLNRDQRTMGTVYYRAKEKRKKKRTRFTRAVESSPLPQGLRPGVSRPDKGSGRRKKKR